MNDQGQDAFYVVAVGADGLVLARQVEPDALTVPEVGSQSLISYLGDDASSKAKAASWAVRVLVAREKPDAAG